MQQFYEKRNYPRMAVDCPANVRPTNGRGDGATAKNLSGGGLLIWLDHEVGEDAMLHVVLKPESLLTPPMTAEVRVLRCTPLSDEAQRYAVACQIQRVLG